MKTAKVINVGALLDNLDSNELRELKARFNEQFRASLRKLEEQEKEQLRLFINSLNQLDLDYYKEQREAVSIKAFRLPMDQRKVLRDISGSITRAFEKLDELKESIASDAKRSNIPYSEVFHTTVKRMKRYQNR